MKKQKKSNKPLSTEITRRSFIGGAAAIAASTIVPRRVLGGPGYIPPSDKINIASIGAGGMAARNIDACSETDNIFALCDVDSDKAADTFEKYPDAKRYTDYREMLEKEKDIEAVIIAAPDHIHAPAAMMAMKLGKHVYVQKPLTHTVYEARKLTETARETKVVTQMGNQGHSGDGVLFVDKIISDGAIGMVREVVAVTNRPIWPQGIYRPRETARPPRTIDWDLWLGPAPFRPYNPVYAPFKWRGWWDFGCGALGDMACHILDPVYYALKLCHPISVEACTPNIWADGSYMQMHTLDETAPPASIVYYEFPARGKFPPLKLSWYDGGLKPRMPEIPEILEPEENQRGRRNRRPPSVVFFGDKGILMCSDYGDRVRTIPAEIMEKYERPETASTRNRHEQNWIQACKGGEPAVSNFDYSGPFTEIVLLGNIAIRAGSGKKLLWDGKDMNFTNEPEANKYVTKEYREGWKL